MMMAAVALLCAAPAANAQKINETALKAKAAKSDSEIADAKKNVKSATWLNRGKTYYEIAAAPSANLYPDMPANLIEASLGKPASAQTVTKAGRQMEELEYTFTSIYTENGAIRAWEVRPIIDGAAETAKDAYLKAIELDPKMADKAKEGLRQIKDYYLQDAANMFAIGEYTKAAAEYYNAYEIGRTPALDINDTSLLFNAGYLYALSGDFDNGQKCLEAALANDFHSDGDIYYLLFHCYYRNNEGDMENSKRVLLEGIGKYPKNNNILESLMMFYSREGSEDDPDEIFDIVKKAIEADPENPDLWAGLGNIYLHTKRWDEAIEAYGKVVELQPDVYINQLRLGYVYCSKADSAQEELSKQSFTSYEASQTAQKEINDTYAMAIPSLEKAHELSPNEITPVEMLKSVYYRFSYDSDEMAKKYEEFTALLRSMQE